ncbi:hypothetical protein [Bradyrhizobium erythrophlei]|uniref:Uncharacterized protein n=1 Tax=Bradyrhizobium erythrophlei TaxID=1437360 RepID=A0A1M5R441_9BRAD|nr:hypothetical protein [Bradyrhizobium erythrophlei]SHH20938.1 hypothetical protein SAMN05444169_6326 [Bradyrhizobium erythrophlei]
MPYPSLYSITYSYMGFQQSQGNNAFPGTQIDADLDGLAASVTNLSAFMKTAIRSDGQLNNGLVTFDTLSPSVQTAGLAPANAWMTATLYLLNASTIQAGTLYRSTVDHTSGVFATDLAAGKWVFVAALTAAFTPGANLQLVGPVFSVIPSPAFTAPTASTAAPGTNSTQLATTAYLDSKLAAANGVATLDGAGKLTAAQIPAALVGAVQYQGTWNASTNSPALASGVGTKGFYYKVSVAGATTIDTISQWNIGDTIIFDGTTWDKIDGIASEVVSVAGRTGVVTLAFTDISSQATLAQLPTLAANTVLGSIAGGAPIALTTAQHTSLVNAFTTTLNGLVPNPGTVASKFLRDDGSWQAVAGAGTVTNVATGVGLKGGPITAGGTLSIDASYMRGRISGLTLSTAGASTAFGIAAGVATDGTNADMMLFASAYTKTTAAWAVGSATGSFDGTGSAPSATAGWYHVHLIKRPDTGVVDILTSLSAAAPTLPANYTLFRRIGSMKTNGSFQWIKFLQQGDRYIWDAPVGDVNAFALSTTSTLLPLTVPPGISVEVTFLGFWTAGTATAEMTFQSPLTSTQASNSPLGNVSLINSAASSNASGQFTFQTDTSQNIRAVAAGAYTGPALYVVTQSWLDTRGRFL